jgi:[ribosomal protein S18]-alanine N-acetyltransferase
MMRLEPVDAAAAAALAALHASAFDHPWSAADIASALQSPGAFALAVRLEDDQTAGFILARAIAGEGEILTLAVSPAARRRGIGRALVEATIGICIENRAESLFLEAAQDNLPAIALYSQTGFESAGLRKGYYRRDGAPAVDALVMRRTLNTRAP